jgi:hypothetical protein
MAYDYKYTVAQDGQIVDCTINVKTSFGAEEAIPFGQPLIRGTDPQKQVKRFPAGGASTLKFLGVSGYDPEQIGGSYPTASMVTVVEQGRVWVPLIGAIAVDAGDWAYLDRSTGLITDIEPASANKITIGRFLTGGASSGTNLFALEIIPGLEV